jgi:dTDP-glucose 4,6-dehydratase
LVFGSRGFVGAHIVQYLEASQQKVIHGERVECYKDACRQVSSLVPDRVVCCLGRTHTRSCASIDGLEGAEAWPDLALANLHAPFWICRATERVCPVLYVGTGCIYTGGEGEYAESDAPNFFGSAYSRVKASTDFILSSFRHVLVARIRMPVADHDSPRDLLCKLWSYPIIVDEGTNSVTVLSDLLPAFLALLHENVAGVFNAVNPVALTHPEILEIFAKQGRSHLHEVVSSPESLGLKALRSRCALSAAKLQEAVRTLTPQTRLLYRVASTIPDSRESLARVAALRCSPKTSEGAVVLVSGGCGFIGSHFVEKWLADHPEDKILNVDCLDDESGARRSNVRADNERYEHVWLDITMQSAPTALLRLLRERSVSKIVHFAAKTHVDASFDGDLSLAYTLTNVLGTHHLLEAARRHATLELFLHISTDEVYGDCSAREASEETILQPTNPYAASKAAAEMLVKAYAHSLKLPCTIVRLNNVYGPRQHTNKVIPHFCSLAFEGVPLPLHGSGDAKRCFIHASDAVEAIAIVMSRGTKGEIYNVGGGFELTVRDLASRINVLAASSGGVRNVRDRPYNDMRYLLDDSKLRALGWAPRVAFDVGLEETVSSMRVASAS